MVKKIEDDPYVKTVSDKSCLSDGKISLEMNLPKDEYVICTVCGHTNTKKVGLCEMCSNYLFK